MGGREAVGAMLERGAAQGPEGVLEVLGEGGEALAAEDDADMLPAAVGEDEVVESMGKGLAGDGDGEFRGIGEVGQRHPAGHRRLAEDDVALLAAAAHHRLHRDRRPRHPHRRLPRQRRLLQRALPPHRPASACASISTMTASRPSSAAATSSAIPACAPATTAAGPTASTTATSSMPCVARRRPSPLRSTATASFPVANMPLPGRPCPRRCPGVMPVAAWSICFGSPMTRPARPSSPP